MKIFKYISMKGMVNTGLALSLVVYFINNYESFVEGYIYVWQLIFK
ncbi:hypothetical protein [Fulvivirga imtechensis]|nr:hypothetical protein [Fulvivirga imtechensis]